MLSNYLIDISAVTSKMACAAIDMCIPHLLCGNPTTCGEVALLLIYSLLGVGSSAYWLLRQEVANTLSRIDFGSVAFVEESQEQHRFSTFTHKNSSNLFLSRSQHASRTPLAMQVINYLLLFLGDEDIRVRTAGSHALVNIIGRLNFSSQLDLSPVADSVGSKHSIFSVCGDVDDTTQHSANLSHIVREIVNLLAKPHPSFLLKGCYQALALIARKYSFVRTPLYSPDDVLSRVSNPMSIYNSAILPLALDRLCSSVVSADLDIHQDVITLIGLLAREAGRFFTPFSTVVLKHLMKVLNIMCLVLEQKALNSDLRVATAQSYFSGLRMAPPQHLGYFVNLQPYLNLYTRLHNTYTASLTTTTFVADKFVQMRESCLITLAAVIRNFGKLITTYNEEIIYYLSRHFEFEPKAVCICIEELFYCTFSQSVMSVPASTPKVYQYSDGLMNDSHFDDFTCTADDIQNLAKTESNQKLIRPFEPLVVCSIGQYKLSHDSHIKLAILRMLSQLVRFGVDFSRLDSEHVFLDMLLSQVEEKNSFASTAYAVVPHIIEFIAVLFIRRHMPQVLSHERLMQLVNMSFSVSTSEATRHSLLSSFRLFCKYLFPGPVDPSQAYPSLQTFREHFFRFVLEHINHPLCQQLAIIILHKNQQPPQKWALYSEPIATTLLPKIATQQIPITCFEDMQNLYAILALISPQVLSAKQWLMLINPFLLQSLVPPTSSRPVTPPVQSNPRVPNTHRASFFSKCIHESELDWLPSLLVLLRLGWSLFTHASSDAHRFEDVVQQASALIPALLASAEMCCVKISAFGSPELWQLLSHFIFYCTAFIERLQLCRSALSMPELNILSCTAGASSDSSVSASECIEKLESLTTYTLASKKPVIVRCICNLLFTLQHNSPAWKKAVMLDLYPDSLLFDEYVAYHIMTIAYCRMLISMLTSVEITSAAFLECLIYNINRETVQQVMPLLVQLQGNQDFILQCCTNLLTQTQPHLPQSLALFQRLLSFLKFLKPSVALLRILVEHFVGSHISSIQKSTEDLMCSIVQFLTQESLPTGPTPEILAQLRSLHQEFLHNIPGEHLFLNAASQLSSLGLESSGVSQGPQCPTPRAKIDASHNATNPAGTSKDDLQTIPKRELCDFILQSFKNSQKKPFTFMPLIFLLQRDQIELIVNSEEFDYALLRNSVDLCPDWIQHIVIESVVESVEKFVSLYSLQSQLVIPYAEWSRQLTNCRCLLKAILSFHKKNAPHLKSVSLQQAISINAQAAHPKEDCLWDNQNIIMLCTRLLHQFLLRWQVSVGNPYDLPLVLQLLACGTRSVSDESSPISETTSNEILQYLYNLYIQVLQPHTKRSAAAAKTETPASKLVFLLDVTYRWYRKESTTITCSGDVDNAFFATVLSVARLHTDTFFPLTINESDTIISSLELPFTTQINSLNTPEAALQFMSFFMSHCSFKNPQQFQRGYQVLLSLVTSTQQKEPDVTEQLKCHALGTLTSSLLQLALTQESPNFEEALFSQTTLRHVARQSANDLMSSKGLWPKIAALQQKLHELMLLSESETYECYPIDPIAPGITNNHLLLVNIERPTKYQFHLNQLSVKEMRTDGSYHFMGLNISTLVSELLPILEGFLNLPPMPPSSASSLSTASTSTPNLSSSAPGGSSIGQMFTSTLNPQHTQTSASIFKHEMIQRQAVESIVLLSDLFTREQHEWVLSIMYRIIMHSDVPDDFITKGLTILAILKSMAVVTPHPSTMWPKISFELVKYALESRILWLHAVALSGSLYLLEANYVSQGLLTLLMRFIVTQLSSTAAFMIRPLLLSVMFHIIDQHHHEAEVQGFTQQALTQALNIWNSRNCHTTVVQSLCLGFQRLLLSTSLALSHRETIARFATKQLASQAVNAVSSLLSFGLTLVVMYSSAAYDEVVTKPSPVDNPASTNNVEHLKLLFTVLRKGAFLQQAKVVVDILPSVMVDLFPADEVLSLILNEFIKLKEPNPQIVAQLMFEVFGILQSKGYHHTVEDWVCMCAPNYLQHDNKVAMWALNCLFLAASRNPLLRSLFPEYVEQTSEPVLILSAAEFLFNPSLSPANKKSILKDLFATPPFSLCRDLDIQSETATTPPGSQQTSATSNTATDSTASAHCDPLTRVTDTTSLISSSSTNGTIFPQTAPTASDTPNREPSHTEQGKVVETTNTLISFVETEPLTTCPAKSGGSTVLDMILNAPVVQEKQLPTPTEPEKEQANPVLAAWKSTQEKEASTTMPTITPHCQEADVNGSAACISDAGQVQTSTETGTSSLQPEPITTIASNQQENTTTSSEQENESALPTGIEHTKPTNEPQTPTQTTPEPDKPLIPSPYQETAQPNIPQPPPFTPPTTEPTTNELIPTTNTTAADSINQQLEPPTNQQSQPEPQPQLQPQPETQSQSQPQTETQPPAESQLQPNNSNNTNTEATTPTPSDSIGITSDTP
ncbi:Huntingtin family protein [Pelomyxa schiedti]|nr:Huntingtin family protein [Pelomyxa schiedti]